MASGYRNLYTPTGGYEEEKLVSKTIDSIVAMTGDMKRSAKINQNFMIRRMLQGYVDPDSLKRCKRTIEHLEALSKGLRKAPF